ncbi:MAG: hypothetical protein M0C28_46245 [Candidatus Moduliflexus flocculans]|nr:hypothetical protein [Candidatus Moduliflexus flocculans]
MAAELDYHWVMRPGFQLYSGAGFGVRYRHGTYRDGDETDTCNKALPTFHLNALGVRFGEQGRLLRRARGRIQGAHQRRASTPSSEMNKTACWGWRSSLAAAVGAAPAAARPSQTSQRGRHPGRLLGRSGSPPRPRPRSTTPRATSSRALQYYLEYVRQAEGLSNPVRDGLGPEQRRLHDHQDAPARTRRSTWSRRRQLLEDGLAIRRGVRGLPEDHGHEPRARPQPSSSGRAEPGPILRIRPSSPLPAADLTATSGLVPEHILA